MRRWSAAASTALMIGPLLALSACGAPEKPAQVIRLATTTSAQDTGLLDVLLPAFRKETGIEVQALAKGTGEALKLGERGDAEVVLVHARKAEDEFLAKGLGVERRDTWWNRFVIVGPAADPAGIAGVSSASEALKRVRDAKVTFVSRGDDSGTHKKELALWGKFEKWPGYLETGQGMGPTLTLADQKDAYTLCDEGTVLKFHATLRLKVLVKGDPALKNPYGVILVRPASGEDARNAAARCFFEWISGPTALGMVKAFTIDGQRPFFLAGESPP